MSTKKRNMLSTCVVKDVGCDEKKDRKKIKLTTF